MMQAPLSPPRSVQSESQLLINANLSPLRPIHALNESHTIDLDTSLDDEYFAVNTTDAPESLFPPVVERDDFMERKYDDEEYAAAAPLFSTVANEAEEFDEEKSDDEEEEVSHRSVLPTPHVHPRTPLNLCNTSQSLLQPHFVTPTHHDRSSSSSTRVLIDYQGKQIDSTMRRNLLAPPPMPNVDSGHQLQTNVFIQAASTSLSIVAPSSLLNSLASVHPGMGMQKLETQLHHLSRQSPGAQKSPFSNSSSSTSLWMNSPSTNYSSPSIASRNDSRSNLMSPSSASPAAVIQQQLGESTVELDLLHVEESAVEEVCDAIEEMGHVDEDDSEEAIMEEQEIDIDKLQPAADTAQYLDVQSPVKQLRLEDFQTPVQAAPELPPRSAPPTIVSSASAMNLSMHSSFALNSSTSVNTSSVSTQVRSGSSKKKKLLKLSALSLQTSSMTLPKIQPPTLEQAQAQNKPSQTRPEKQVIASKLKTIKKKLATRPALATSEIPPSTRTSTSTAAMTVSKLDLRQLNPAAFHRQQDEAKLTNKPKSINGPKALLARLTSHALSHAIELQEEQQKQAPNPWMTAEEIEEQEERERLHDNNLLLPSHRVQGHIEHTPAKKSREEVEEDEAAAKALQIRSVDMALPTASIRSMVPSLWQQQIHSDKIHDNMQYFTVAYDY